MLTKIINSFFDLQMLSQNKIAKSQLRNQYNPLYLNPKQDVLAPFQVLRPLMGYFGKGQGRGLPPSAFKKERRANSSMGENQKGRIVKRDGTRGIL